MQNAVAVFYQAAPPPPVDGVTKPMKPGGYSDSGADIGFALKSLNRPLITPVSNPDPRRDFDWVFPDTEEGIESALKLGAQTLWMNTVLFSGHPMEKFFGRGLKFVCQHPKDVELYDDKFETNRVLLDRGLPVAHSALFSLDQNEIPKTLRYPLMLKPVRGRGSAGVTLVHSKEELARNLAEWSKTRPYGSSYMLEEVLPGEEITITITVMPRGDYQFGTRIVSKSYAWAMPPIRRFDQVAMVAPWNGTVPVVKNSIALTPDECDAPGIQRVMEACEEAGEIMGLRAPIRIDCRQDTEGRYRPFDVNPKPNITGAGRTGRETQDSLVTMAALAYGISYPDLMAAVADNAWTE